MNANTDHAPFTEINMAQRHKQKMQTFKTSKDKTGENLDGLAFKVG